MLASTAVTCCRQDGCSSQAGVSIVSQGSWPALAAQPPARQGFSKHFYKNVSMAACREINTVISSTTSVCCSAQHLNPLKSPWDMAACREINTVISSTTSVCCSAQHLNPLQSPWEIHPLSGSHVVARGGREAAGLCQASGAGLGLETTTSADVDGNRGARVAALPAGSCRGRQRQCGTA